MGGVVVVAHPPASPSWSKATMLMSRSTLASAASFQGLTLVHFSAQLKRFLWDKGCLGGVQGEFMAGVEGVLRRLGDVLSVRNGSG